MGKRVISLLVNALCALAIALSLLAGWAVISAPPGKAPQLFGCSLLTVVSGSMAPALPTGSLVIVRETPANAVAVGDIISFYTALGGKEGVINTHRVTEIRSADGAISFLTRGDANPIADEKPVPASALLGRVVFYSPAFGGIVALLRQPMVYFLAILVPLLILLLRAVLHLVRLAKTEITQAEQEILAEYAAKEELDDEAQ